VTPFTVPPPAANVIRIDVPVGPKADDIMVDDI
jgi:hypothetical protein